MIMNNIFIKIFMVVCSCTIGYIILFSQDTSLINPNQKAAINKVLEDINKAPDFIDRARIREPFNKYRIILNYFCFFKTYICSTGL